MIWILLLLWIIITYTHPWIDCYKDYKGSNYIVLWYTNFKGERKFVNLLGSQN